MKQRNADALAIQWACNPAGIARALVKACDEARAECTDTMYTRQDPAVRLIVHQLAFLCKLEAFDDFELYHKCIEACREG